VSVEQHKIESVVNRSIEFREELKRLNFTPDSTKSLNRTWSISEVGKLIKKTPQAIRDAEKNGKLPEPTKNDSTGRRKGYSLDEINTIRKLFPPAFVRNPKTDAPCILAVQNFKGGVGKSTIAVHLSQYFTIQGFKVLLIDLDSQASTTTMMGYNPDIDISEDDTLLPFLLGEEQSLDYAIRDTYWGENLKLIPANLQLYGAEYGLAGMMSGRSETIPWMTLKRGLSKITKFDIVILDPPPALGMISLNTMYAANALVIPMPPNMLDLHSTFQFFTMMNEVTNSIGNQDDESSRHGFNFIKILSNRKKQRTTSEKMSSAQDGIISMAKGFYAELMLDTILYESAEIETAAIGGMSIFEMDRPATTPHTHARAINNMEDIGAEILNNIIFHWQSNRAGK
jgi:chromosome partitioning protein